MASTNLWNYSQCQKMYFFVLFLTCTQLQNLDGARLPDSESLTELVPIPEHINELMPEQNMLSDNKALIFRQKRQCDCKSKTRDLQPDFSDNSEAESLSHMSPVSVESGIPSFVHELFKNVIELLIPGASKQSEISFSPGNFELFDIFKKVLNRLQCLFIRGLARSANSGFLSMVIQLFEQLLGIQENKSLQDSSTSLSPVEFGSPGIVIEKLKRILGLTEKKPESFKPTNIISSTGEFDLVRIVTEVFKKVLGLFMPGLSNISEKSGFISIIIQLLRKVLGIQEPESLQDSQTIPSPTTFKIPGIVIEKLKQILGPTEEIPGSSEPPNIPSLTGKFGLVGIVIEVFKKLLDQLIPELPNSSKNSGFLSIIVSVLEMLKRVIGPLKPGLHSSSEKLDLLDFIVNLLKQVVGFQGTDTLPLPHILPLPEKSGPLGVLIEVLKKMLAFPIPRFLKSIVILVPLAILVSIIVLGPLAILGPLSMIIKVIRGFQGTQVSGDPLFPHFFSPRKLLKFLIPGLILGPLAILVSIIILGPLAKFGLSSVVMRVIRRFLGIQESENLPFPHIFSPGKLFKSLIPGLILGPLAILISIIVLSPLAKLGPLSMIIKVMRRLLGAQKSGDLPYPHFFPHRKLFKFLIPGLILGPLAILISIIVLSPLAKFGPLSIIIKVIRRLLGTQKSEDLPFPNFFPPRKLFKFLIPGLILGPLAILVSIIILGPLAKFGLLSVVMRVIRRFLGFQESENLPSQIFSPGKSDIFNFPGKIGFFGIVVDVLKKVIGPMISKLPNHSAKSGFLNFIIQMFKELFGSQNTGSLPLPQTFSSPAKTEPFDIVFEIFNKMLRPSVPKFLKPLAILGPLAILLSLSVLGPLAKFGPFNFVIKVLEKVLRAQKNEKSTVPQVLSFPAESGPLEIVIEILKKTLNPSIAGFLKPIAILGPLAIFVSLIILGPLAKFGLMSIVIKVFKKLIGSQDPDHLPLPYFFHPAKSIIFGFIHWLIKIVLRLLIRVSSGLSVVKSPFGGSVLLDIVIRVVKKVLSFLLPGLDHSPSKTGLLHSILIGLLKSVVGFLKSGSFDISNFFNASPNNKTVRISINREVKKVKRSVKKSRRNTREILKNDEDISEDTQKYVFRPDKEHHGEVSGESQHFHQGNDHEELIKKW